MNTRCDRSAEQLASTAEGEAWYGDSLREILLDVTANQARARPIPDAHSIWELVLHLDAWVKFFSAAIRGTAIPPWPAMSREQDFPLVTETTDAAWETCVGTLLRHHMELAEAIEHFGDERLESTVPGRSYTFDRLFQSASLHAAYHAGQIALLKKMVRTVVDS
jgi:hypothetical protein